MSCFCLLVLSLFQVDAFTQDQSQTLSPEQLEIFRNMPAEQRDALIEQILGTGEDGLDQRDRRLEFPETIIRREREGELDESSETGEPRFKAEDTLLLLLEIREFSGPDPVTPPVARNRAQPAPPAAPAEPAPPAQAPEQQEQIIRTPQEEAALEDLRSRIQGRNPYRLDRLGRLEVGELGLIALAGLTEEQARRRLSVEPLLSEFKVEIIRLPLERTGEDALKPFGYELFAGIPSTFAPATDVPVPADYVIGPGDQIRVQLFGGVNQGYLLTVGRDGQINFPRLGPIDVAGQTFLQMRGNLEERVARQMIGTNASVTVGETRSIRIFVLGDAYQPGSYTVSGLSTITNALFVSGGVTEIGSLRNIQLKRSGRLIGELDLYDLLLHGDTSDDSRLLPGDVIFIPPVGKTVAVAGEVRRPAIYEINGETTAQQLVTLAGGLTPQADPAIGRLERTDEQRQRVMLDVDLTRADPIASTLASGDVLRVLPIRTVLENSVLLQGHLHRPGAVQYRPGMRISDVIRSLDELRPQADPHYVLIRRELPPDRRVVVLSADLGRALMAPGSEDDVEVAPRDRIHVFDRESGRDRVVAPLIEQLQLQSQLSQPTQVVGVGGRVKAPGQYPLEPGMRVSDLIRAGGSLEDAAYGGEAELTRHRVVEGEYRQSELLVVNLAAVLRGDTSADVELQSYDFLNVKELPQWSQSEEIEIVGEVRFPGKYPVRRGEMLSSVLKRAGGLTDLAFPEGSIYLREELREKEQQRIEQLATRLQSDIAVLALQATQDRSQSSQALTVGQSLLNELRNTKAVGRLVFDLEEVIANEPGSRWDIGLKDGDRILIPRRAQEVTVLGEVNTITSHLHRQGLTREDYIDLSGGTTQKADERRTYVVRADGSVVTDRGGWFGRSASEIRAGDSIVVPLDAERMRPLALWTAVAQIIYPLAIAAAAVNSF
ncbi:MAG: SLBB domain-containing protein [Steroidobacteraceae bacterium]